MEDKVWYLQDINVLKSLNESALMQLGALCSMMKYAKGDRIYLFEEAANVYFLKSGSVKVVRLDEDGNQQLTELIEPGEIFGRLIGEDSGESNLEIVSLEDSLVCFLPFSKWQEFIKDHPLLSLGFIKWAGARLKRMEVKMDGLIFKSSRERIVEKLHDTIKRFGKPDGSGNIVVSLSLTHDEIAQLTGTSRQNVNAYLTELRAKGLIEYDRTTITVTPQYFENFNGIKPSP